MPAIAEHAFGAASASDQGHGSQVDPEVLEDGPPELDGILSVVLATLGILALLALAIAAHWILSFLKL